MAVGPQSSGINWELWSIWVCVLFSCYVTHQSFSHLTILSTARKDIKGFIYSLTQYIKDWVPGSTQLKVPINWGT